MQGGGGLPAGDPRGTAASTGSLFFLIIDAIWAAWKLAALCWSIAVLPIRHGWLATRAIGGVAARSLLDRTMCCCKVSGDA